MEQQRKIHDGCASATSLGELEARLTSCEACPRLVAWRQEIAETKRAAFRYDDYWGRPVPGFGDPEAEIVVVGLAPAAHGANRTGRMFTGDRSGEWLYRALYRAGLANQPTSVNRYDGLVLSGAWVTAAVRCAPPQNKPTPGERDTCSVWFDAELSLLRRATVFVVLGQFAYHSLWSHLRRCGLALPTPRPSFGHGEEVVLDGVTILMSYHVSQQNTFTGRLSVEMLDDVFTRAVRRAGSGV